MRSTARHLFIVAIIAGLVACTPNPSDGEESDLCDAHGGDTDDDGVCDELDNCIGADNADQVDTDGDGAGDACDGLSGDAVCVGQGHDNDSDGVCAAVDNCPDVANAGQQDKDGDGVGDACDATPAPCDDWGGDQDFDSICSNLDNCPEDANFTQADSDQDGVGDACDATVPEEDPCAGRGHDADGDGICSAFDKCPDHIDPAQRDADGDGIGDACDATPARCDDDGGDLDLDGVCGDLDNCPSDSNPTQVDADVDGIGDHCDPELPATFGPCAGMGGDTDGDDLCGMYDNCPSASNGDQSDLDNDGIGDACDSESCDGIDNDGDGEIDEEQIDSDGDEIADCVDVCPTVSNTDSDGDAVPDCADACPLDPFNDVDGDNVCGDVDNCPFVPNGGILQRDTDGDGIGDLCDVEECDGVTNDSDAQIDEDLPDEDDDGLCDERDPCLGDRLNDPDQDGVCGLVDNCHGLANAGQDDADGDGSGDECDLNAPAACGPAAALWGPGSHPLPPTLAPRAVAATASEDVVFVSLAASDPTYPNEVIAVHAPSSSVLWSTFVGSSPSALALSDDGALLYVALDGAAAIRVVDVTERRACRSFSLGMGTGPGETPLFAGDLAVVPGAPSTLVVSTRESSATSQNQGGVYAYDAGLRRPVGLGRPHRVAEIEVSSTGRIFGYDSTSSSFDFYELQLLPEGLAVVFEQSGLISGFGFDIRHVDGRIYAGSGAVLDVQGTPMLAGNFGDTGALAVEPSSNEAFMLISNNTLAVFDTMTFVKQRQITLASTISGAHQVERWGAGGLVIASNTKLMLVPNAVAVSD